MPAIVRVSQREPSRGQKASQRLRRPGNDDGAIFLQGAHGIERDFLGAHQRFAVDQFVGVQLCGTEKRCASRAGAQHRNLDRTFLQLDAQPFGKVQHIRFAGVISAHPRARLKRCDRSDVENLPATLQGHAVADRMAQPGEGEDVHFDQVLLGHPVLGQERSAGADAGAVDQQVDLPVAFFQFQQKPGQAQRLAQVTGPEQHSTPKR